MTSVEIVQSFRRSGTGVLHVGVDVGAGDAEVDVIYILFVLSVQYIGYLIPYKDSGTTRQQQQLNHCVQY